MGRGQEFIAGSQGGQVGGVYRTTPPLDWETFTDAEWASFKDQQWAAFVGDEVPGGTVWQIIASDTHAPGSQGGQAIRPVLGDFYLAGSQAAQLQGV